MWKGPQGGRRTSKTLRKSRIDETPKKKSGGLEPKSKNLIFFNPILLQQLKLAQQQFKFEETIITNLFRQENHFLRARIPRSAWLCDESQITDRKCYRYCIQENLPPWTAREVVMFLLWSGSGWESPAGKGIILMARMRNKSLRSGRNG